MAGGHKVYGVYISPGMGYRNDHTSGVATGSQPQGAYMVASGTHVNSGCCFDYGNAETSNNDTGNGHMDAVYFGTLCWFAPCSGKGTSATTTRAPDRPAAKFSALRQALYS